MKKINTNDEFYKNEIRTNKVVAMCLFAFVVVGILDTFLIMKYSSAAGVIDACVFFPMNVILVIMDLLACYFRFSKPWIKYMLLSGIIFACSITYFVFTLTTIYLVFLPIFISTRYFDKKIIIDVSISTIFLFVVSSAANVVLEKNNLTFKQIHADAAYNYWTNFYEPFVYIVLPCFLLLVFMSIVAVSYTNSGRKLMESKIKRGNKIAAVEAEIGMAADIQKSFLPKPYFKTENGNFEINAYENPAKEVCGDYYDYFMVNDNLLAVVVADVSDKGLPAAMFMMLSKKVLQAAVESNDTLEDAIKVANRLICSDNKSEMFMTLWMGIIDVNTGVGKYINAGHPFPILKKADGDIEIIENKPDLFLGNFPDKNPTVYSFHLEKDEALFIYTDGLTDAVNSDGESFGVDRVVNCIKDTKLELSAATVDAVSKFSNNAPQFDDITMMSIKCNNVETFDTINLTVPVGVEGTKQIADSVQQVLTSKKCPDPKRRNIGVVVDEICNNISEYAYREKGKIIFDAVVGSNYIVMEYYDNGREFNPLDVNDPTFEDSLQIGGYGIYYVKKLSDKVTYEYRNGYNIIKVLFIWNI